MNERRPYSMAVRAERTAATRQRILEATQAIIDARSPDFTLENVAEAAGTSVKTVLRAFGSKDQLYIQAIGSTRTPGQAVEPAVGDVDGAIGQIYDDYERIGDRVIGMLAEEHRMPALTEAIEVGRTNHREWVEHVFAPQLRSLRGATRRRTVVAVVAATDIYIWKLLRRDYGLERAEAETIVRRLVAGAIENHSLSDPRGT
jgi:AcrR family transcriptional regulator